MQFKHIKVKEGQILEIDPREGWQVANVKLNEETGEYHMILSKGFIGISSRK